MLLEKIEKFIKRTGKSDATFGREAMNDPRLIFDLRNGRSPSLRTVEKIEKYMAGK